MEKDGVACSKTITWFLRTKMLQAALKKRFAPLKRCGGTRVKTTIHDGTKSLCFSVMASYTCDISEEKDVFSVKHGCL